MASITPASFDFSAIVDSPGGAISATTGTFSGKISTSDTTNSTSTTSAASGKFGGGVSIAADCYALSFYGTTTVSAPQVMAGSTTYASNPEVVINAAASKYKLIKFQNSGLNRWSIYVDDVDSFYIRAYDNTGTAIDDIISGSRIAANPITFSRSLAINGNSSKTISLAAHTTANTAGNDLGVNAGSATSGATDKNGGMRTDGPGLSTGTGLGSWRAQRLSRAASTGTSYNTRYDAIIVCSQKHLTDGSATSLFEVALASGAKAGGHILYSIIASDGTDHQVHSGWVAYSAVSKGGTITSNISEIPTSEVEAKSSGTITDTWSIADGGTKITIQLNANTSLTATELYIVYTIFNNSLCAITQL